MFQVSAARLNVTENVTIYIDWVQRFNFSNANASISFIAPEAAANNSYAQILVSDAMGIDSVTPDRLYYSDKVRVSYARVLFAALPATSAVYAPPSSRHDIRIRLVLSARSAKVLGTMGPAWTASRAPRSLSVLPLAPLVLSCIFSGVSCRARFVPEATVAGPCQGTGTKAMYAFLPQSRRARWRCVRSSVCLQDDPRVVPCDPPAEERCRGVNNTDAAPLIIDSCPDPLDRATCYAVHSENGCGKVYYAGLPPVAAKLICSMCTVLNAICTVRYRVWLMRRRVFRDGEEMCPVQPSIAAHHVSPTRGPCFAVHDRWLRFVRSIGVSIFLVLFELFVFFVNVDIVLAVWDVVSESDWCLALEPMALRLFSSDVQFRCRNFRCDHVYRAL